MSSEGTIIASHVWKRFRADMKFTKLKDELNRLRASRRGDGDEGWRWALRDVEFLVEPGESVGLIGSNGSGKSTLLKILTRVMYPYAGRVEITGRVGALIQVVEGIHPDLSGRENVYLYGSLLGLKRADVAARFDAIVDFAEIGEAIDRQVKFYSSGMKMRLGFSVAAFLEPDILLVDEVLAVGDAPFQQKCLDRMRYVLNLGTTLVLVSHDLASIEAACTRGAWLDNGVIEMHGPVRPVLSAYRSAVEQAAAAATHEGDGVRVVKTEVVGTGDGIPRSQEPIRVLIGLEVADAIDGALYLGVSEGTSTPIFVQRTPLDLPPGETVVRCDIASLPLPRGRFFVWVGIVDRREQDLLPWYPAASFDTVGPVLDPAPRAVARLAPVHVAATWTIER